ncbi:MAG: ATP-binding protein [Actinobacteria bacterium]|nr:ATP-binding protein [Actinomycetota bacterium]
MFVDEIRQQLQRDPAESDAAAPISHDETAPRIAVYDSVTAPPRVLSVPDTHLPDLIDALASKTYDLARQQGSRLPYTVLREVIENLIHAWFSDVVITILDDGNTIRIADRGPGIGDKAKAFRPGFSTAGPELKRFIKGVGSGLPIAKESLGLMEGMLDIEDNLGQGTVVTLKLPPTPAVQPPAPSPRPLADLSERQLKMLSLLLELGPVGPSRIGRELSISASTSYRDLVALEALGMVASGAGGRRSITKDGLHYLDRVL